MGMVVSSSSGPAGNDIAKDSAQACDIVAKDSAQACDIVAHRAIPVPASRYRASHSLVVHASLPRVHCSGRLFPLGRACST
jgi:hypothetical protein